MNATGRIIPVLARDPSTGAIEAKDSHYEGNVPVAVWVRLKKEILRLDKEGYFFPLDTMDAYQQVARDLEEKALEGAAPQNASLATYLTTVMHRKIYKFRKCNVLPVRAAYRQAALQITTTERSNAIDSEETGDETDGGLTLQELCETLPAKPSYEERRRIASGAIDEILEALDDFRISQAFIAYVIADGNLDRTAEYLKLNRVYFYQTWREWLARARCAAEKIRFNPLLLEI